MYQEIGLAACVDRVATFTGKNLTSTISKLQYKFENLGRDQIAQQIEAHQINADLLRAALFVKHSAAQIDVVIHALGILALLPTVLDPDETLESLSLGAGSSEKNRFDVETNRRVAEFTFIEWQGNDNTRLQKMFKDFFRLAEYETTKTKELWLTDDQFVLKYLRSGTSIRSATHKHRNVWESFVEKYPKLTKITEYYRLHESTVHFRVYPRDFTDSLNLRG